MLDIETLYTAVDVVRASRYPSNARALGFLRTYPLLLANAQQPAPNTQEAFVHAASLAYAWMPQPVRFEMAALPAACAALEQARQPKVAITETLIEPIADCLSSLEGAIKMLHLVNPASFPLWDRSIERFRLQDEPSNYHMEQARMYLQFLDEVQGIIAHPDFLTFHFNFCTAHQDRLQRWRIPPYPLTEPRVVEAAARELACQGECPQ